MWLVARGCLQHFERPPDPRPYELPLLIATVEHQVLPHTCRSECASRSAGSTVIAVRELEIPRMIASGLTDKEIDYRLGIEVSTVRTHSNRIFSKAPRTPPERRRQGFRELSMSTLSMRRRRRQTSENPVNRHPDRKQPSIAARGTVEF